MWTDGHDKLGEVDHFLCVSEVLVADFTFSSVNLTDHGFDQTKERAIIVVFSIDSTNSKLNPY